MTQNYEHLELDEDDLSFMEEILKEELTIIKEEKNEDDLECKLENDLYVIKVDFAERVTRQIVQLSNDLRVDDKTFESSSFTSLAIKDRAVDAYAFIPPEDIQIFCCNWNDIYMPTTILGGVHSFFPHMVTVDARTNRIIVRMRPLTTSVGKFFDFFLVTEEEIFADNSASKAQKRTDMALRDYFQDFFEGEYNKMSLKVRKAWGEYNRSVAIENIAKNYKEKGIDVW